MIKNREMLCLTSQLHSGQADKHDNVSATVIVRPTRPSGPVRCYNCTAGMQTCFPVLVCSPAGWRWGIIRILPSRSVLRTYFMMCVGEEKSTEMIWLCWHVERALLLSKSLPAVGQWPASKRSRQAHIFISSGLIFSFTSAMVASPPCPPPPRARAHAI